MTNDSTTIEEFDQWNDDLEDKAIEEFASRLDVKHIIKDGEYVALLPGGTMLRLPLALKVSDFTALASAGGGNEGLDMLRGLMSELSGGASDRIFDTMPLQTLLSLSADYGAVLAKTQNATLGKYSLSAD